MTNQMEMEFGLLSLTDVVWNHTAENSDWLQDHPEAGFNLYNSPHLIAAYHLDTAMLEFGSNLRHLGYPTHISTMDDLLKLMEGLKTHVLGGLRLWEYYIFDVNKAVEQTINCWKAGDIHKTIFWSVDLKNMPLKEKAEKLKEYLLRSTDSFGERFKKTIDASAAGGYLHIIYGEYKAGNVTAAQRDLTSLFNEMNLTFYREFDDDREAILENTFNRIKYVRLDLKNYEISERYVA
jgi:glycogen debranching enzyme